MGKARKKSSSKTGARKKASKKGQSASARRTRKETFGTPLKPYDWGRVGTGSKKERAIFRQMNRENRRRVREAQIANTIAAFGAKRRRPPKPR